MAQFMRFYHTPFDDMLEMPARWFFKLYSQIDAVRAAEALYHIPVYAYADLEKQAQNQMYRQLQTAAKGTTTKPNTDEKQSDRAWDSMRAIVGG